MSCNDWCCSSLEPTNNLVTNPVFLSALCAVQELGRVLEKKNTSQKLGTMFQPMSTQGSGHVCPSRCPKNPMIKAYFPRNIPRQHLSCLSFTSRSMDGVSVSSAYKHYLPSTYVRELVWVMMG